MRFNAEDFRARYAALEEAKLLELARAYDSLTPPAQAALRSEFAKRDLKPPLVGDAELLVPALRSLVTLVRYRDLSEAIVARSLLESAGIQAWIRDENLGRLEWQISNFIGGLRLQVEVGDAESAALLLEQTSPDPIPWSGEDDYPQPRCPICDSTHVSFQGSYRGAALVSLYVFSLPLPLGRETWCCNACGGRWENSDES